MKSQKSPLLTSPGVDNANQGKALPPFPLDSKRRLTRTSNQTYATRSRIPPCEDPLLLSSTIKRVLIFFSSKRPNRFLKRSGVLLFGKRRSYNLQLPEGFMRLLRQTHEQVFATAIFGNSHFMKKLRLGIVSAKNLRTIQIARCRQVNHPHQ